MAGRLALVVQQWNELRVWLDLSCLGPITAGRISCRGCASAGTPRPVAVQRSWLLPFLNESLPQHPLQVAEFKAEKAHQLQEQQEAAAARAEAEAAEAAAAVAAAAPRVALRAAELQARLEAQRVRGHRHAWRHACAAV